MKRVIKSCHPFQRIIAVVALLFVLLTIGCALNVSIFRANPYVVAVIVSSADGTEDRVKSVKFFVQKRIDELNAMDAFGDTDIVVKFYDDLSEPEQTPKVVERVLSEERLIGIIGIWNSTRTDLVNEIIAESGVPFLGDFSITSLAEGYDNIYSIELDMKTELSVFAEFLHANEFSRIALIRRDKDLYTDGYEQLLNNLAEQGLIEMIYQKEYERTHEFEQEDFDLIKSNALSADLIVLSLGSKKNFTVIQGMRSDSPSNPALEAPVFSVLGTLPNILIQYDDRTESYGLYDIVGARGVPGVNNERLEVVSRSFQGELDALQIERLQYPNGARYADAVGILAEAYMRSLSQQENDLRQTEEIKHVREHIVQGLATFSEGKDVYRGWVRDWSFTDAKASAEDAYIVWSSAKHRGFVLAPEQHARLGNGFRTLPVVYVGVDLVGISRVDDELQRFQAVFYLSWESNQPKTIDDFTFTNASKGLGNESMYQYKEITNGDDSTVPSIYTKKYIVSGTFDFVPEFDDYPFDKQNFTISFQPEDIVNPFLIQPPDAANLRDDRNFVRTGWDFVENYVGLDQEFVSAIEDFGTRRSIAPVYKFDFTWRLARADSNFATSVIWPLFIILVLSYLPVWAMDTNEKLTDVIQIQAAALLAAIALYFAIYKPQTIEVTLFDRTFLLAYLFIGSIAGLTMFKTLNFFEEGKTSWRIITWIQRYCFPAIVIVVGIFLFRSI